MQIMFNPELTIEDFEDGKMIVEIATEEGFYIEADVFALLAPALEQYVEARSLFPAEYTEAEYLPFLEELLALRLLHKKE